MKEHRAVLFGLTVVALLGLLLAACASQAPAAEPDITGAAKSAMASPHVTDGAATTPTDAVRPEPRDDATRSQRNAMRAALTRAKAAIEAERPQPAAKALSTLSSVQAMPPPGASPAPSTVQRRGRDAYGYSTGGSATVNDAPYDSTFFKHYGVNPFVDTENDHFSTFAMDVDTASYTVMRRFLRDGHLPDPDSVRVEEFVNFFDQGYEQPEEAAFAIHIDGSPSPFGGENHWLMRVGLQGRSIAAEDRNDATLIFVIDVSGSMSRENRLGLVKRSLHLLVSELRPADEVGIVIYGSRGSVLLQPTSGDRKETIMGAIDALRPGGSTNAAEGLVLGYEMAIERVQPGRITRLLLLSDGVANVGRTGADSILELVNSFVEERVRLSTVGFGMGNYNDVLMERLANDSDGSYAYVDTLAEARRIFVENLTGTLQIIAKDAKVQVDFDPQVVSRYRLVGYENRRVADRDFRNDAVDAGEVGAGHTVTALYELKLKEGASGPIGTVYVRYEDPDTYAVTEISRVFDVGELALDFKETPARFQLAAVVAEYAEILRQSYWAQESSLGRVAAMAQRVHALLPEDMDVGQFVELVAQTAKIG